MMTSVFFCKEKNSSAMTEYHNEHIVSDETDRLFQSREYR